MTAAKTYESDWAFEARLRRRIRNLILFSVALLISLLFFFPVYLMFSSSFKSEGEIFAIPMHWIPHEFQGFRQYEFAFESTRLERWYINSLVIAAVQTIATVFFGALAGYGFAKFRFPARNILFLFILSIMTVPFQILVIPMFVLVHQLGWHNTYQGLIMPGLISAFGVFMMRQFAYSVPDELLDAARIDGASEFSIFRRIVMPMLKPAAASLAIITFLFSWNSFLWPLVVAQNRDLVTLPVGLTYFSQSLDREPLWAVAMAVSTMATIPVILLFVFFQRYFIEGMMVSGIKG
ncbi:MAG: carbohydrate ABC transporter permease [Chloroflexota bacterium]|nr:carbohydrate ABC transporter permease [Chloroflexota bacterium]MDE2910754.1 carbohydrate ABC transporter permease [Chloroflexota bacterium]